jgi:hypothetical protein
MHARVRHNTSWHANVYSEGSFPSPRSHEAAVSPLSSRYLLHLFYIHSSESQWVMEFAQRSELWITGKHSLVPG